MKNLSYAEFLKNRRAEALTELEYDTLRTAHPKPSAGEVCVPVYTGFYKEKTAAAGQERTYYIFIPTRHPASGPQLMLLTRDGQTAAELLAHTPWVDLAEEKSFVLMVLEPADGAWDTAHALENEVPYLENAQQFAVDRNLYSVNESGYYAAGYGAGGYVGQLYAAKNCSVLSGYASIGGPDVPATLLNQLGAEVSIGDPVGQIYAKKNLADARPASAAAVRKRDVPLPVWIIEDESECPNAVTYWKTVNRAELKSYQENADVYAPDIAKFGSLVNTQPVQQVWHSAIPGAANLCERGFIADVWKFLRRVKRHAGITLNGTLRPTKTWQELGMRRYTDVIAGLAREWYVYVPSAHYQDPEKKLPLVVAIHGYSCSGELFMGDSEWYKVAEERGFFVLFGSASVGGRIGGMFPNNVPLPAWNSFVPQQENGADDLAYFDHVVRAVEAEFPIDPGREYVSGHSNGSMMTQCLLVQRTAEFAAYAPEGFCFGENATSGVLPPYRDRVVAPVWFMKGTFDIGCQADFTPGCANREMVAYCCRENGIDPDQTPDETTNGRFHNRTYVDQSGNPCVIFTELIGYPHAYTPEVSWMIWDAFFSHIRRREDGTIEYLK